MVHAPKPTGTERNLSLALSGPVRDSTCGHMTQVPEVAEILRTRYIQRTDLASRQCRVHVGASRSSGFTSDHHRIYRYSRETTFSSLLHSAFGTHTVRHSRDNASRANMFAPNVSSDRVSAAHNLLCHSMSSGNSARGKGREILPAIETSLEIAKASVSGLGIIGLEAAIGGLLSIVTALKVCPLELALPYPTNSAPYRI